ncbi:bifunctional lysylphosphatidylglycerol flippase/synthetase MprF [Rhizobium sp. CG5]|uniref:phosphatidylglycerol lysyltransferase domain-containing protein n=1 Tax=Rhizobium sp. CG5 TaxID=2726076 RepID=UPI002033F3F5|nr:phosphatidylglycerol lysyltransferase domain-containing protein [Rhizobium sp. CG5]MCM2476574.1 bifunctional lysylphosphatidylglycerol flippase/synthetase MprF [Rhizobium sp. CG5]
MVDTSLESPLPPSARRFYRPLGRAAQRTAGAVLSGVKMRAVVASALVALALVSLVQLLVDESVLRLGWQVWRMQDTLPEEGPMGLALFLGMLATRRFTWRGRTPSRPCPDQVQRAVALLDAQPHACAGLVRLGDKSVLFSDCGKAFIMYARKGRSLVALFDPVGDRAAWPDLVAAFCDLARRQGCRPVFYQVSQDFLPHAVDLGLHSLKLGEQAVVDLTTFDTRGGDWVKLRRSINRAERDGLQFAMLSPAEVLAAMDDLENVSNAWLAQHNAAEKGFSLGTFKRDYVASGPVAVIRLDGRIVAFASILTADAGGDAFIDLMRHLPDTHRGMMDLLFVRTMEHLKGAGYRALNLGMAPLAGLSSHAHAPLWNRIGRRVYRTGERYYNFQGVHSFKSKFDPQWQPRYFVVKGAALPVVALFDVTMLIGGGLRGVLRR